MKKEYINSKIINMIAALAIFNFTFLGTEYLFDNMMAYVTDSKGVVIAQGYVLGASVIGFILFPVMDRFINESAKFIVVFGATVCSIICIFVIQQHSSYYAILISGCIVFVLMGVAGSAVHYIAARMLNKSRHLATVVGLAYAFGIMLQFVNNNLVNNDTVESVVISSFLTVLVILLIRINRMDAGLVPDEEKDALKRPAVAGGALVIIVALMTCVFSTLDNAVTLVHAEGSVDIGQWPRLLLALSGIAAGILFDIKERRFMNIIMYCVTLLSTACVVVIELGGTFIMGLVVFYLSAGFFVVYFTTGFIDLSCYMRVPALWAGMGRAVNNICAVITGTSAVSLLTSHNGMTIIIVALILFALISVAIYVYTNQFRTFGDIEEEKRLNEAEKQEYEAEKLINFSEHYSLTDREREVLKILITSDASVQDIADLLFISRAALYRHIGNLNEKTDTKTRIGLIQFYYGWNNEI